MFQVFNSQWLPYWKAQILNTSLITKRPGQHGPRGLSYILFYKVLSPTVADLILTTLQGRQSRHYCFINVFQLFSDD